MWWQLLNRQATSYRWAEWTMIYKVLSENHSPLWWAKSSNSGQQQENWSLPKLAHIFSYNNSTLQLGWHLHTRKFNCLCNITLSHRNICTLSNICLFFSLVDIFIQQITGSLAAYVNVSLYHDVHYITIYCISRCTVYYDVQYIMIHSVSWVQCITHIIHHEPHYTTMFSIYIIMYTILPQCTLYHDIQYNTRYIVWQWTVYHDVQYINNHRPAVGACCSLLWGYENSACMYRWRWVNI